MTDINVIYANVCEIITKDDFKKRVQIKLKEFDGLCDENMAAMLVANELNVSESKNTGSKICPLRSDYRDETQACLREGCQLWGRDSEECAFQSISSGLWAIVDIMGRKKGEF